MFNVKEFRIGGDPHRHATPASVPRGLRENHTINFPIWLATNLQFSNLAECTISSKSQRSGRQLAIKLDAAPPGDTSRHPSGTTPRWAAAKILPRQCVEHDREIEQGDQDYWLWHGARGSGTHHSCADQLQSR